MSHKNGCTLKFVSISVVSVCDGASWCERAAVAVTGRILAIAQAPVSVDSLTVMAGVGPVIRAGVILLGFTRNRPYSLLHPPQNNPPGIVLFLFRIICLQHTL